MNNPTATSSVPTEYTTIQPAIVRSDCAASTPSAPKASVTSATGSTHAAATSATSPAPGPNTSGYTRRIAYTPTLVRTANKAAVAPVAAA